MKFRNYFDESAINCLIVCLLLSVCSIGEYFHSNNIECIFWGTIAGVMLFSFLYHPVSYLMSILIQHWTIAHTATTTALTVIFLITGFFTPVAMIVSCCLVGRVLREGDFVHRKILGQQLSILCPIVVSQMLANLVTAALFQLPTLGYWGSYGLIAVLTTMVTLSAYYVEEIKSSLRMVSKI